MYPSARGQSRLGPSTMAMLLGVILFTACCSDNRDKNWTRYLTGRKHKIDGVKDRDTGRMKDEITYSMTYIDTYYRKNVMIYRF